MCGRIVLKAPASQVAREFDLAEEPDLSPGYNIAPGQSIAAVRAQPNGMRTCARLRWGLIPPWATSPRDGDRLFNARSETADRKPAFREAFAARRCLVVVDGFYEWRKHSPPKQPYYFSGPDERLLALAGLWSGWVGPAGEVHESCTILTTEANKLVRPVHDRMPVTLTHEQRDRWLMPAPQDKDALRDLLEPAADGLLRAWAVGHAVNRSDADGPELCAPLEQDQVRQFDLF